MRLRAFAPAKINLFLHVGAPRADGKHPLCGLTVFADVGDVLTLDTDGPPGLRVTGPFAQGVPAGPENLVARALAGFGAFSGADVAPLGVTLEKHLPSAAGIGGGTSDAGAALRLARAALAPALPDAALMEIGAGLGADGPMCLFPRVAWTEGLGEILTPEPRLPPFHGVLVNPGVPVLTGRVFAAWDSTPSGDAAAPSPPMDWSPRSVVSWLAGLRNDLQAPAENLHSVVAEVRALIQDHAEVRLARMSGSGGTVFALCDDPSAARRVAAEVQAARPQWWVRAVSLGDMSAASTPNPTS